MNNTTSRLAMYLTSITLGVVLLLVGISWLWGLGCAIIWAGSIFSPLSLQPFRSKSIYYAGLLITLGCGVWQFIQAERYGYLWQRVPLSGSLAALLLALWLLLVVGGVAKHCRERSRS